MVVTSPFNAEMLGGILVGYLACGGTQAMEKAGLISPAASR